MRPLAKIVCFIVVMCGCISAENVFAQSTTIQRYANIPSVKMTHQQLNNLIARLLSLTSRINQGTVAGKEDITLSISARNYDYSFDGAQVNYDFSSIGEIAYRVRLKYRNTQAEIPLFEFNLSDRNSDIIVSGNSVKDIDAVVTLVTSDLDAYSVVFTGSTFRSFGGAFLWLAGMVLILIRYISKVVDAETSLSTQIIFVITGVFLQITLWVFPWKDWLPGTKILPPSPSLADLYGFHITLLGVFLTVLMPIVVMLIDYKRVKRIQTPPSSNP